MNRLLDGFTSGFAFVLFARLVVIFTTLPVHECAHGVMAYFLGDDTAAKKGRLTLNPLAHIDPRGALFLMLVGFGWAKPVPIDPRNFEKKVSRRFGIALTALAGPLANVLLAFILLFFYKGAAIYMAVQTTQNRIVPPGVSVLADILSLMIGINLSLAVFNMLPVPPLDGFNVIAYFLPKKIAAMIWNHANAIFTIMLLLLVLTPFLDFPIAWMQQRVYYGVDAVVSHFLAIAANEAVRVVDFLKNTHILSAAGALL